MSRTNRREQTTANEWLKRARMEIAQGVTRSYSDSVRDKIEAETHVHHAVNALEKSGFDGLRQRIDGIQLGDPIDANDRYELREVMSIIDSELSLTEADR